MMIQDDGDKRCRRTERRCRTMAKSDVDSQGPDCNLVLFFGVDYANMLDTRAFPDRAYPFSSPRAQSTMPSPK